MRYRYCSLGLFKYNTTTSYNALRCTVGILNIHINEVRVGCCTILPVCTLDGHVVTKSDKYVSPGYFDVHSHEKHTYENRLDSLAVECCLRLLEVPGSISSHEPRYTKDSNNDISGSLVKHSTVKGKHWLFLKTHIATRITIIFESLMEY